jgi:FixJ family two-component response regulator
MGGRRAPGSGGIPLILNAPTVVRDRLADLHFQFARQQFVKPPWEGQDPRQGGRRAFWQGLRGTRIGIHFRATTRRNGLERVDTMVTQGDQSKKSVGSAKPPVVFVVDDDDSMRMALTRLFYSIQLRVEAFASAQEFLRAERSDAPSCLVLDVRLPGLSGLDFQAELGKADIRIPIVFITGHGDIPMSVRAMKAGAVDFLTKPFRDQDLLDAVAAAVLRDQERREHEQATADLRTHFELPTPREREIMALVASALMSKQIAAKIECPSLQRTKNA